MKRIILMIDLNDRIQRLSGGPNIADLRIMDIELELAYHPEGQGEYRDRIRLFPGQFFELPEDQLEQLIIEYKRFIGEHQ